MKTSIINFTFAFLISITVGYAGNRMPLNTLANNYFEKVTTYSEADHITILWETSSTQEEYHFVILVSIDNVQFIPVNQISGISKTGMKQTYSFTYTPDMTATYYFKIKAVETSGTTTESKVITYQYTTPVQMSTEKKEKLPINTEISFNIPF
jgi:hypothetical protein